MAEGQDLKEFWNKHGEHYQMCLKNMGNFIMLERNLRESERDNKDSKK